MALPVGEVGGLAVQHRGPDGRAVPLGGEVAHPVEHQPVVERGRGRDGEGGRDRGGAARAGGDPVGPGAVQPGEVKPVDRAVGGVPGPGVGAGPAAEHHAVRTGHGEADLADLARQHHERHLGAAGRVPDLVDPDLRRRAAGAGPRAGTAAAAPHSRLTDAIALPATSVILCPCLMTRPFRRRRPAAAAPPLAPPRRDRAPAGPRPPPAARPRRSRTPGGPRP